MTKEVIRKIEYGKHYYISSEGKVFSDKNGELKELSPLTNGHGGYKKVRLYNEGKWKDFFIHRLVASAFIPNPNNLPIINHIDENPLNNAKDNLEWCSVKYNRNYGNTPKKIKMSMKKHFEENPQERERMAKQSKERKWRPSSKKKIAASLEIPIICLKDKKIISHYKSAKEAEEKTGIKRTNICKTLKGIRKSAGGYQWIYAACGGELEKS